ncbi:hypothetical protein ABVT39_000125 [Epinephelus coioides]
MEDARAQLVQTQTQQAQSLKALQDTMTILGQHLATILAYYGHNLLTRAQPFHSWAYDPNAPVRQQIATLIRLICSWLSTRDGPPALDRLVMDQCIQALPAYAKRYVSQSSPETIDALVALLENHQVTVELMRGSQRENPRPSHPNPREDKPWLRKCDQEAPTQIQIPQQGQMRSPPRRKPLINHDQGGVHEESMLTAGSADAQQKTGSYLTIYWAHEHTKAPKLPIRIGGRDAEALLDSGSYVTLLRPELSTGHQGPAPPLTSRYRPRGRNSARKKPQSARKVKPLPACAVPSGVPGSSGEETSEDAPGPAGVLGEGDPGSNEASSEAVFSEAFSEFPLVEEEQGPHPGKFRNIQ